MLVLFIAILNLYFIALYNSTVLDGNILVIGMFFGFSEIVGVFVGERLMVFHPTKTIVTTTLALLGLCTLIKTVALTSA